MNDDSWLYVLKPSYFKVRFSFTVFVLFCFAFSDFPITAKVRGPWSTKCLNAQIIHRPLWDNPVYILLLLKTQLCKKSPRRLTFTKKVNPRACGTLRKEWYCTAAITNKRWCLSQYTHDTGTHWGVDVARSMASSTPLTLSSTSLLTRTTSKKCPYVLKMASDSFWIICRFSV